MCIGNTVLTCRRIWGASDGKGLGHENPPLHVGLAHCKGSRLRIWLYALFYHVTASAMWPLLPRDQVRKPSQDVVSLISDFQPPKDNNFITNPPVNDILLQNTKQEYSRWGNYISFSVNLHTSEPIFLSRKYWISPVSLSFMVSFDISDGPTFCVCVHTTGQQRVTFSIALYLSFLRQGT